MNENNIIKKIIDGLNEKYRDFSFELKADKIVDGKSGVVLNVHPTMYDDLVSFVGEKTAYDEMVAIYSEEIDKHVGKKTIKEIFGF